MDCVKCGFGKTIMSGYIVCPDCGVKYPLYRCQKCRVFFYLDEKSGMKYKATKSFLKSVGYGGQSHE